MGRRDGVVGPAPELVDDALLHHGRPHDDAEGQGQEHGHDGDQVITEGNQWVSEKMNCRTFSYMSFTSRRSGGEISTTTTMASSAAEISSRASRPRMLPRYMRETPFASTRISPTRSRTRKVLAIPIRPLSRNSRRFP